MTAREVPAGDLTGPKVDDEPLDAASVDEVVPDDERPVADGIVGAAGPGSAIETGEPPIDADPADWLDQQAEVPIDEDHDQP